MTYLDELLKRYPRFYDKRPTSNHHKYHAVSGEGYLNFKRSIRKVELARRIARPIKIWKSQILPYQYSIDFSIDLENLKRVQLYRDPSTLLIDSGELVEGTEAYSGSYGDTSGIIVPSTKYYIKVEDWDENIYYKGIPENDEILGDKYDRDSILDVYGANLGIERRTYVEPDTLSDEDYPNTVPPYCNTQYESDKFYEERILRYMDDLEEKNLPTVEIKRLFEVNPAIEGRWRHIVKMDRDVMVDSELDEDGKYMATDEWNRSVYDISVDLGAMPPNIPIVEGTEVQQVLDKTVPLSKKAYFSMFTHYYTGDAELSQDSQIPTINTLYEDYNLAMLMGRDNSVLREQCVGSGDIVGGIDSELLYETYVFRTDPRLENQILSEGVIYNQFDNKYYASSIAEFNAGTHVNTTAFTWSGQDYIAASYRTYSTDKTPAGYEQSNAYGPSWSSLGNAADRDDDEAVYTFTGTYALTEYFYMRGFSHNIPSNAIITGVVVGIKRSQSGTIDCHDHYVQLVQWDGGTNSTPMGNNKATTAKYPQRSGNPANATWAWYGGSSDKWGCGLTVDMVNNWYFGVKYQGHNNSGYTPSIYVNSVVMGVYYTVIDGYFTSQQISYDSSATGWDKLYLGEIWNPLNTMWVNVLRASDNAVLLESLPYSTIDISSVQHTNIKVRVGFSSNDLNYNPSLGSITVKNKKRVYY